MTSIRTWLYDRCSHMYKNKCRGKKRVKTQSRKETDPCFESNLTHSGKKGLNTFKASSDFCDIFCESCQVQMSEGRPSHIWTGATVPPLIKTG